MHRNWLAIEHHRLHSVEEWPNGPRKEAVLHAIRSSIASVSRKLDSGETLPVCEVCLSRLSLTHIVAFPGVSQTDSNRSHLAA